MPGYGIPDSTEGLLPWSWAVERLSKAHNYFVATTRPGGRPHVVPVWGLWLDPAFYFGTGTTSRKARNLAANPHCVVCPENAGEAVIVEGLAEGVTDPSLLSQFKDAYLNKYRWEMDTSQGGIYAVRPKVVFGFIESGGDFPGTATRWLFAEE
jgi:nitroimidazol reductase NimA-like FMN-containing flavoprotein (pyridoxamine 5'-phosphate oxidase superfamily)